MHDHGQSDRPVVPMKFPNKAGGPAAEGLQEAVEVPAPVAAVERERIAREDPLEPGLPVEFCSAGPPSLAPSPRPPYLVVVGRDVRR
jgi:hypothetical protein